MASEHYVSDNPYRLLSVASENGYQILRRKADGVARSIQVGIAPEIAFANEFGDDLQDIQSRVRSLATDPVSLIVYRMMWPLEEVAILVLVECAVVPGDSLRNASRTQVEFLLPWYQFLLTKSPDELRSALDRAVSLGESDAFAEFLSARLSTEEGIRREAAAEHVAEAGTRLLRHLGERSAAIADEVWALGRHDEAITILGAVLRSRLGNEVKQSALAPGLARGERLVDELRKVKGVIASMDPTVETELLPQVSELELLASAIGDHPSAGFWKDTSLSVRTAFAGRMREVAIDLANNAEDYEAASNLIQKAQTFNPSEAMIETLRKDARTLRDMIHQEAAWKGVCPVKSAPELRTLNGIGFKMYGSAEFAGDRRYHFSNLYLTFFYLPVFPIARYLVQREGDKWRFFGKTSWTSGMKAHLAFSCVAIVLLGLGIVNAPSSATSARYDSSAAASPSTVGSPPKEVSSEPSPSIAASDEDAPTRESPTEAPSNPDAPEAGEVAANGPNIDYSAWQKEQDEKEQHREILEEELTELKSQIKKLRAELDASDADIHDRRASLEAMKAEIKRASFDDTSQEQVDAYNVKVDEYEKRRDDFNGLVDEHNATLKKEKGKVKRHNEIVRELNAGLNR